MVFNCCIAVADETIPFHADLIYENETPKFSIAYDGVAKRPVPTIEPISLMLLMRRGSAKAEVITAISPDKSEFVGADMVGIGSVLDEMSVRVRLQSGLYLFYSKDREQQWIPIYREESAGKMDVIEGINFDDPKFIEYLIKENSYEGIQGEYRKQQIELTENTKQYLFAHPYTIALSLDGKPGFRLKLMATNNTQNSLGLPKLNTPKNRLEIEGFNKDNIWSYPRYPLQDEPGKDVPLQIGETRSWVEDIGRYIQENGIRRPGRYIVHWILDDKEVANFVFYLPEPKAEKAQVK